MPDLFTAENLIALATLTSLEIVLGIDNIIFISILVGKLPAEKRDIARKLGLALAMISRIVLLFAISWIMLLTQPLFSLFEHAFSGRDLILILGGLFLLGKATFEIHDQVEEGGHHAEKDLRPSRSFASVLTQIAILDIVFSLDSVITAVGMVQHLPIMIISVIIAVLVMLLAAKPISEFIEVHPTFKVLALSFLILIGMVLVLDGCGKHVEKAYIYFAMGFSILVEVLNMRIRRAKAGVSRA